MSCSMLIGQQDNSRAVSSSITGSRRCMQMLDYLHINKIQLKIKCSIYILYILVITHANIHTYTVRIGNPLITDNTCASRARAGSKFSMSRAAPATGVALFWAAAVFKRRPPRRPRLTGHRGSATGGGAGGRVSLNIFNFSHYAYGRCMEIIDFKWLLPPPPHLDAVADPLTTQYGILTKENNTKLFVYCTMCIPTKLFLHETTPKKLQETTPNLSGKRCRPYHIDTQYT